MEIAFWQMNIRSNNAHALDAGLRLYFIRAPMARASDAQRSAASHEERAV